MDAVDQPEADRRISPSESNTRPPCPQTAHLIACARADLPLSFN